MSIELNHMMIPVEDKETTAKFYSEIFGLERKGPFGPFEVIHLPSQNLALDFDSRPTMVPLHYAFKVSEEQFDEIFSRVKEAGIAFGGGPYRADDGQINTHDGGRGVYFKDPNGHQLEIITRDYGSGTPG